MSKLFDIFSKDVRSRTALVVFMMGMQQLSGIDGVLYVCSELLVWFSGTLTSSLVRSVALPAGRTCLVRSKLLCLRHLGTRNILCDYFRIALRRQMGPPRQCHLRWHWTRRCHVPDRWTVRRKCRSRDIWSWPLGGNCCHLHFCRHLLHDMGSQHQDLRARDPSKSHPCIGNNPGSFLKLDRQLLGCSHNAYSFGEKLFRSIFPVWWLLHPHCCCVCGLYARNQGPLLGRNRGGV